MRRPLWATIAELADALQPRGVAAERLRMTEVLLDLSLELQLRETPDGFEMMGNARRWRLPTAFEPPPARLKLVLRPTLLTSFPVPEGTG